MAVGEFIKEYQLRKKLLESEQTKNSTVLVERDCIEMEKLRERRTWKEIG
jgi:hypothetical protein